MSAWGTCGWATPDLKHRGFRLQRRRPSASALHSYLEGHGQCTWGATWTVNLGTGNLDRGPLHRLRACMQDRGPIRHPLPAGPQDAEESQGLGGGSIKKLMGGGNVSKAGGRAGGRAGWLCHAGSIASVAYPFVSSIPFVSTSALVSQLAYPCGPQPSLRTLPVLYLLKHCMRGGETDHWGNHSEDIGPQAVPNPQLYPTLPLLARCNVILQALPQANELPINSHAVPPPA